MSATNCRSMTNICMSVSNKILQQKTMLFKTQSVQYTCIYCITRRCNSIHFYLNLPLMSSMVKWKLFISNSTLDIMVAMICDNSIINQADKIIYLTVTWNNLILLRSGTLPLSGVYISNVHYDCVSQPRTMVLSRCVKWSMTCIITITGAPLVVTRHRDETGRNWTFNSGPQQHVTTKTTTSNCDMVFNKSENIQIWFQQKNLTLWARRKPEQVYESRIGYLHLDYFFRWSGDVPNRVFL